MGNKVKHLSRPITIRLDEGLRGSLESYCEKEGVSISSVIRTLLLNLLLSPSSPVTKKKARKEPTSLL